jgi:PAS domain S-box-containing protein
MKKNPVNKMADSEQMKLLQEAFASFNSATAELQQSYADLKQQVKEMNIELEETNKKLKKNLKEKEELQEYLQNVLENAPNGVVVIDNKGRIKNFNKTAEEITGFKFKQIENANIKDIFPQMQKAKEKKGKIFFDNCEIRSRSGEEKIINIYISKLKDRKKRKIGNVIAFEDITNIKMLEEQIQRKNRLEAMGEMAAGISHEIRNPLGAIELFASLLKRDLSGDSQKEELVENILAGVKSLSNITSNLLLFTKNVKPKKEPIDIAKVIDDALIFTNYATYYKKINLKKNVDKRSRRLLADAELLKQVFLNLVLNAVQAIKKSGNIIIAVKKIEKSSVISMDGEKDYVQITVEDTGPGISKKNVEKVFNPFFTTKKSGLGLGLAIVHKIISSHDGMIEVSSRENVGTKFSILLPVSVKG